MKRFLLVFSILIIYSCSYSNDKIDYEFSSELLFIRPDKKSLVSKIEVYKFSASEGKHFVFGVNRSTKNYKPVKVFKEAQAQNIFDILSKNTGREQNCRPTLSDDVYHFVVRIKASEKIGYFLAQPCSPHSGKTAMISHMYSDGDNATAYSRALLQFIAKEIIK